MSEQKLMRLLSILIPYHDRRNCFAFAVTPGGSYRDGTFFGDSEDNPDLTWDPVWQVETSIDSLGWTAEFRIPLSQLRFEKARTTWPYNGSLCLSVNSEVDLH